MDATPDGTLLVYTDSDEREVGFVDITDPAAPVEARAPLPVDGIPDLGRDHPGRPLGAHRHRPDRRQLRESEGPARRPFAHVLQDRRHARPRGQPDSIAISDGGRYAAVAIENERDENVNDGDLPQSPAGFLAIVDLVGRPAAWGIRDVPLTGLPGLTAPSDPEPEYVDINHLGIAALTLQENNAVVLVRLWDGKVLEGWSAGSSTHLADLQDDDVIFAVGIPDEEREPDSIAWTPLGGLITANEADWVGGSRDFTIFGPTGRVRDSSGATYEQHIVDAGLYSDGRSDNRGTEPEGVEVGRYGTRTFAFVGAERADAVVVYRLPLVGDPVFAGSLVTGYRPEGLLALPARGLFVAANEGDGTISTL